MRRSLWSTYAVAFRSTAIEKGDAPDAHESVPIGVIVSLSGS